MIAIITYPSLGIFTHFLNIPSGYFSQFAMDILIYGYLWPIEIG